jgi:hypothetical protein
MDLVLLRDLPFSLAVLGRVLVFVSLLLLSSGLSWDWTTHQYAAREICSYVGCGGCLEAMLNGSIAPDRDFKDNINHHCYDPSHDCPNGDWICPDRFDCPALEKSDEWLTKSREAIGCEKFYDIGVASHYYLDSRVFWHQVTKEDESNCHARFEKLVGENINNDFNVSVCGINITKADFEGYVSGFEGQLGPKDYTKEIVTGAIIALLVLVTALRFRK